VRLAIKMFVVGLLATAVVMPFPEAIVGLGRIRGIRAFPVLVVALAISMAQLVGEYWLVGQARDRVSSYVRLQWLHAGFRDGWQAFRTRYMPDLDRYRSIICPVLEAGGYTTMCVGCLNPIPFTPISRMAAVAIWRTAKLPGSMTIIVLCTIIKYCFYVAGISLLVARH